MSNVKKCNKCKLVLPLNAFHRHIRMKGGRRPTCCFCLADHRRQKKYAKRARQHHLGFFPKKAVSVDNQVV